MGTPGGSGVSGAAAPSGSGQESEVIAGMGIQAAKMVAELSLLKAQKDNINADTQQKNIEAAKTAGVDTTKTIVDTDAALQGIQNAKAQEVLTKAQAAYQNVANEIQGKTIDEQVDTIKATAQQQISESESAMFKANVDNKTQNITIAKMIQEGVNTMLQADLIKAGTALQNHVS